MADRPVLARRGVLAAGAALTVPSARAETDDRQRITLGNSTFLVPKPYLFGEFLPPGTTTEGLPPLFSFAFTMPDGAPAGEGIEFPPMSHPFVLEREGGRFLVMCYRVSASGPKPLHVPPREQLANALIETPGYMFSAVDNALSFRPETNDSFEERYVSFLEKKRRSLVQALLMHIETAQFFYGAAEFEKPGVTTVIYVPQERHSEIVSSLALASNLLMSWKVDK